VIKLLAFIIAAALALACATATAQAKTSCVDITDFHCVTHCYYIGSLQDTRTVSTGLLPEQVRYRKLTTRYQYALTLKGTEEQFRYDGTNYQRFYPSRFFIQGRTTASAARHPRHSALGSRTELRLHGSKTKFAYGISYPFGIQVTWEDDNHTTMHAAQAFTRSALSVDSMVAGTQNGITGDAGRGSGLQWISLRSGVIAGRGTQPYLGNSQTWQLQNLYQSKADKPLTLQRQGCSGIAWSN
jgi:hypothetical protein